MKALLKRDKHNKTIYILLLGTLNPLLVDAQTCESSNDVVCINNTIQGADTSINNTSFDFIYKGNYNAQGSADNPIGRLIFMSGDNSNLTLNDVKLNAEYYGTAQSGTLYGQQAIRILNGATLTTTGGEYTYSISHNGIGSTFPTSWQSAFYLSDSKLILNGTNISVTSDRGINNSDNILPTVFYMENTADTEANNLQIKTTASLFNIRSASKLAFNNVKAQASQSGIINSSTFTTTESDISSSTHLFSLYGSGNVIDINNSNIKGLNDGFAAFYVSQTSENSSVNISNLSTVSANYLLYAVNSTNTSGNPINIDMRVTESKVNGIITTASRTTQNKNNIKVYLDNSEWLGNAVSTGNSALDINLIDNSTWSGSIKTNTVDNLPATSAVTLDNSYWNLTDNSSISTLSLSNNSVLTFTNDSFKTLNIERLRGDDTGTFIMNTSIASETGDFLNVTDTVSGSFKVQVKDSGYEPTTSTNPYHLIHAKESKDDTFSLANKSVDLGTYKYFLQRDNDDWYLESVRNITDDQASSLSTAANAVVGMHSATASMWEQELGTLITRMGDLRLNNNYNGGVWVRQLSHEIHATPDTSRAYQQQYNGTQIGIDKVFALDRGKLYLGVMSGFSRSSLDFKTGSNGSIKSNTVGIYVTTILDNGFYFDTVVKYGHMKNKMDYSSNNNGKIKASYSTQALGASIEGGKRFINAESWFIEPQLQLTASHLKGNSYKFNSGMNVKSHSMDMFNGRAGIIIGTKHIYEKAVIEPYIELSHIQELSGSGAVTVNNHHLKSDQIGTRRHYGAGINFNLNKEHNFFVNASYENGDKMEQPWSIKGGYQFRF